MSRYIQEDIPITPEMIVKDKELHAHWERVFIDYDLSEAEGFTDRLAMCSNCKHIDGRYTYAYVVMQYLKCPHCNARMDEVKNEQTN